MKNNVFPFFLGLETEAPEDQKQSLSLSLHFFVLVYHLYLDCFTFLKTTVLLFYWVAPFDSQKGRGGGGGRRGGDVKVVFRKGVQRQGLHVEGKIYLI